MNGAWQQLDRDKMSVYPKAVSATLDKFDSGDVLMLAKDPLGTQYYYNGITLVIVGNNSVACDDGRCQKEKLKDELFMKLASARMDISEVDACRETNKRMMEVIKGNGLSLSKKDVIRLPRLNESSDLETVILVQNILKEKYNVDIQREGIQA